MLMNRKSIVFLIFILLACTSAPKNDAAKEYSDAEDFFNDQIFHSLEPFLEISPTPRFLTHPKATNIQIFEAYGYRIYLPWKVETKTIRNEFTSIIYTPGQFLLAFENPDDSVNSDLYVGMLDALKEKVQLRNVYQDYVKSKSNYDFVTAAFNITNDTISIDDPLNKKLIAYMLLLVKSLYLHENEEIGVKSKPFYHFESYNIKGYQIGDTINGDFIRLSLFPNDTEELNIIIGIKGDFIATQSNIDFIIQRIEKIN